MSHPKELKSHSAWWEMNKELYKPGTEAYNRNAPGIFNPDVESDYDKERKYHGKQDEFTRKALAAEYKKKQLDAGVYDPSAFEDFSYWYQNFFK